MTTTLYEGYKAEDVLAVHFGHHFCGPECAQRYLENHSSNIPGMFQKLFGKEPSVPDICLQCDDTLTYSGSSAGWGYDRTAEQQDFFSLLSLTYRGRIPDDGEGYAVGYTDFIRDETGKGFWMPTSIRTLNGRDMKRSKKMSEKSDKMGDTVKGAGVVERVKSAALSDAREVAARVKARQLTNMVAAGLAKSIGRGDNESAKAIAAFLEGTSMGRAIVGTMISAGAELLPGGMRSDELNAFLREVRIGALSDAGSDLAEMVIAPLREAAAEFLLPASTPAGPALSAPKSEETAEPPKKIRKRSLPKPSRVDASFTEAPDAKTKAPAEKVNGNSIRVKSVE